MNRIEQLIESSCPCLWAELQAEKTKQDAIASRISQLDGDGRIQWINPSTINQLSDEGLLFVADYSGDEKRIGIVLEGDRE